jgi:AmmeMemoRadiSam system protein B
VTPSSIRSAAVAGMFYPADAGMLAHQVDDCLRDARAADPAPAQRPPKLIVVPHAGFIYSGLVAARAYARLVPWRTRITRVAVLGPVHRVPVRGLAAPSVSAFETPLGRVAVDQQALQQLRAFPQVVFDDRPHALEHSLEVQLPFLQRVLAAFTLVPLAVGDASPDEVAEVLERLWGGEETLVVVSTDLSHYLPYAKAQARDSVTVARVLAFDSAIAPHEACGALPLDGALVVAQRRRLVPHLLDLRNSGDTAGDRERVVGYAAIVFDEPQAAA